VELGNIEPLGDQAALVSLSDEEQASRLAARVRSVGPAWLIDVVQAYQRVAIFFDLLAIRFSEVSTWLRELDAGNECVTRGGREHLIPCCYELGPDLLAVADYTRLSTEEVIRHHTGTVFTVYAIGFCPGFPYLGYLPPQLCGVPRLPQPRLRVEAGSVGLAGRQTGIYTEPRPGGWHLIGRTPLELVNVADGYFPLRTGDRVRFEAIDRTAFERRAGERLVVD